jgi:hypothetical protein
MEAEPRTSDRQAAAAPAPRHRLRCSRRRQSQKEVRTMVESVSLAATARPDSDAAGSPTSSSALRRDLRGVPVCMETRSTPRQR